LLSLFDLVCLFDNWLLFILVCVPFIIQQSWITAADEATYRLGGVFSKSLMHEKPWRDVERSMLKALKMYVPHFFFLSSILQPFSHLCVFFRLNSTELQPFIRNAVVELASASETETAKLIEVRLSCISMFINCVYYYVFERRNGYKIMLVDCWLAVFFRV
jgi:hypothetical protein